MIWIVLLVVVVVLVTGWRACASSQLQLPANREGVRAPILTRGIRDSAVFAQNVGGQKEKAPSFVPPSPQQRGPIRATTRVFAVGNDKRYGYYSYLIFGSNAAANRSSRLAAARAYLDQFPPVTDRELRDVPARELNVFVAPIVDRDSLPKSAEELLTKYDYWYALNLLRRVGREGDGIYIVSYPTALDVLSLPNPNEVVIQDLSAVPTNLIELWILEFRRQVRQERQWNKLSLRNAILRLRTALPLAAEFVRFSGIATAGEK